MNLEQTPQKFWYSLLCSQDSILKVHLMQSKIVLIARLIKYLVITWKPLVVKVYHARK